MYFDFEDYRPEFTPVGRAISWREGILLSIIVHLLVVIFLLIAPRVFHFNWTAPRVAVVQPTPHEPLTFVFVQPRVDTPAPKAPERAAPSDRDRIARAPERAPNPTNLEPFSRGNSPDRVDRPPAEPARGRGPQPEPQAGPIAPPPPEPPQTEETPPLKLPGSSGLTLPQKPEPQTQAQAGNLGRSPFAGGSLGRALSNLQTYIQSDQFRNLQGGVGQAGNAIQFDTKGVEFGPWIRRFVERVRSNWNVPYAAMSLKGHVVITFNIHKTGAITDLSVVGPCPIESFNSAAFGALVASNPTDPLPAEYPDEKAFFTVTFYYNEPPPQ